MSALLGVFLRRRTELFTAADIHLHPLWALGIVHPASSDRIYSRSCVVTYDYSAHISPWCR